MRGIPKVDKLLSNKKVAELISRFGRKLTMDSIRSVIDDVRACLSQRGQDGRQVSSQAVPDEAAIVDNIEARLRDLLIDSYGRVINATGVILHTGLGRSPYPEAVAERVRSDLTRYSLLEISPRTGERRNRETFIERLLQIWTGAEAALVVNNNAAATYIILNTLAKDREVLISRSHLVEIGGSYRLPDVLKLSGAILKEVGTTNRTYLSDFRKNISENTALLLYVHKSNFVIKGYASDITIEELAGLSRETKIPFVIDLGSGAPFSLREIGGREETTIQKAVDSGAALVCFSADKLMGSCQGGIILGSKAMIEKIRKNQFYRVVRPGKFTFLALEETLKIYLKGNPEEHIPIYRFIHRDAVELRELAESLAQELRKIKGLKVEVKEDVSEFGGGTLPDSTLPTYVVGVSCSGISEDKLAASLRLNSPPVFARITKGQVLFDVRTLFKDDIPIIEKLLASILCK